MDADEPLPTALERETMFTCVEDVDRGLQMRRVMFVATNWSAPHLARTLMLFVGGLHVTLGGR